MTRYTVVWHNDALDQFAAIWINVAWCHSAAMRRVFSFGFASPNPTDGHLRS
jgi:hypothetical protein